MCPSRSGWRRGQGDQMTHQTTLNDAQYARLEPLLPPPSNHLKIPHRQALDSWLYFNCHDCTSRGLPCEVQQLAHDLCAAQPLGQDRRAGGCGASTTTRTAGRLRYRHAVAG